jgi:tetratricopeptide (TPR) repeat protein
MDANPPQDKVLTLEPVNVLTPGVDVNRSTGGESSADAKAKRDLHITTTDEFLAKAAKEYQEGQIDPTLWRRAADQCGDDRSLVVAAYLRNRATALQLQQRKQDERFAGRARRASKNGSMRGTSNRKIDPEPHPEPVSSVAAALRRRIVKPKLKYLAAAAAALAFGVAVVWLIGSSRESELVRQPTISAAASSPNQSARPMSPGSEQPVVGSTNQDSPEPTLETKVQELKKDGNWHVLVPYASDWTRKEPNNAAAWYELSVGYAKLRQFHDALEAATKAVQLSPGVSLLWSNLGRINLALDRLPEAGIAFDRALALSPDGLDALCGAALVAHRQGLPKDSDAIAKRVKSLDASCPAMSDGESATVAVGGSAVRKPLLSTGR